MATVPGFCHLGATGTTNLLPLVTLHKDRISRGCCIRVSPLGELQIIATADRGVTLMDWISRVNKTPRTQ